MLLISVIRYDNKFTDLMKHVNYKCSVYFILFFSALVRCIGLTDRYLWCDEASSVLTSRYDVTALLYHASFDVHPPLYYVLLHGWMIWLGDGIMAVRSLSVLFGVMTVALTLRLTRELTNARTALLSGWLMAMMPLAVRYSQEARMYALMGLLILAATLALVMWLKTPATRRYLVAYVLLMTLSFYTHYFTIFALVAQWCGVVLMSWRQVSANRILTRPAWWLANIAIGVAYIPWLLVLLDLLSHLEALRAGGDVGWITPVTWRDLPAMFFRFLTGSEGLNYPGVFLWLVLLVLFGACCGTRRGDRDETYGVLLCNLWVPVILVFALSWLTPLFVDRYVFFASLSLPIVLAIRIAECRTRAYRSLWITLLSVVSFFGLYNAHPSEKDAFRALVQDMNIQYAPDDVVVVSDMFHYLSYVYYNEQGHRALLYTPTQPDGTSGQPNAYGFGTFFHAQAAHTYVDDLATLSPRHRRVWLVSGDDFTRDFKAIPPGWVSVGVVNRGWFSARLFVTEKQQAATKPAHSVLFTNNSHVQPRCERVPLPEYNVNSNLFKERKCKRKRPIVCVVC